MNKLLFPTLTLAAGLAVGWFGHHHWQTRAATVRNIRDAGPPPATSAPPEAIPTGTQEAEPREKAAAAASLADCRQLLKSERNPARASVKILAMLDGMDAAAVSALAGQLNHTVSDWSDTQSGTLLQLIYGKLAELDPAGAMQTALLAKDNWGRMNAAGAVIEQLARSNPAAAEAAIEKVPNGFLRKSVAARLAGTLAQSDGPGAVAMLQRMKTAPNDWPWRSLYTSWAAYDPAAAAASLQTMPRQTALGQMDVIASTWARREPDAAMAWAKSIADPAQRNAALRGAIGVVAQSDPQQATALAAAQPAGERRTLLTHIASSMAEADAPAALAWAQSLTDPIERQRSLAAVVHSAGWTNPAAAREALNLLPPGTMRNQALESVVGQLSHSDPAAAQEMVLGLKPNEQTLVMRHLVSGLASTDPVAAEKMAAGLPLSGDNSWAWRSIAENKAITDPAAALTWAGGLDTEQARVAATGAVFEQWAQHSPEKAASALTGITDSNLRRQATEKLAANWASRSPAEAEQWASGLIGDDRITALSAVWNASAGDDPQRAAGSLTAIVSAPGSESATDRLAASAASIAASWTGQNPSEAAAWAGSLPDGKVREDAMGKVAAEWARTDPEAVSQWINGLPHDGSRDAAIGQLVGQIAGTDPESAFTWAASVSGDEKRIDTLKAAAAAWKNTNPEAARTAVRNADLTAEMKLRVLETLR